MKFMVKKFHSLVLVRTCVKMREIHASANRPRGQIIKEPEIQLLALCPSQSDAAASNEDEIANRLLFILGDKPAQRFEGGVEFVTAASIKH